MNERDVRLTAHMDGERVVVKNIGRMRKVSEMELMVLCAWAQIGVFGYFADACVDPESIAKALQRRTDLLASMREEFGSEAVDGCDRLAQTCAAMLGEGRLKRYTLPLLGDGDDEAEGPGHV